MKIMITQDELKAILDYNPITGHFTNRCNRGPVYKGFRAGSPSGHGYRKINLGKKRYYEHHLAWLFVFGEWPDEIDHIDRNGSNNAISNLRKATRSQNCCNSATRQSLAGLRGAYLDKRVNRWYSHIQMDGEYRHLGMFENAEQAHAAYMQALTEVHGEFVPHEPNPEKE
jgi:hypothetical protein